MQKKKTKSQSHSPKSQATKCASLYQLLTGQTLDTWQKQQIFAFFSTPAQGEYFLSVPRQNGKTEILVSIMLYNLFKNVPTLYTAHLGSTATAIYDRVASVLLSNNIEFAGVRSLGEIKLPSGARLYMRTRSPKSGIGEVFTCLLFDESQELLSSYLSLLAPTISTKKEARLFFVGTAPNRESQGDFFLDRLLKVATGEARGKIYGVTIRPDTFRVSDVRKANPAYPKRLSIEYFKRQASLDFDLFCNEQLGLVDIRSTFISEFTVEDLADAFQELQPHLRPADNYTQLAIVVDSRTQEVSVSGATVHSGKIYARCIATATTLASFDWITTLVSQLNPDVILLNTKIFFEEIQLAINKASRVLLHKTRKPTGSEYTSAVITLRNLIKEKRAIFTSYEDIEALKFAVWREIRGSYDRIESIKENVGTARLTSLALATFLCVRKLHAE